MLQFIIGPILSTIGALGKSWLETRKVKAEGKIAIAQANVAAVVKKVEQQGQMDLQSVDGMQHSWKDEAWTIWFIGVLTACFIPWSQPYVKEGFIFLKESAPEWFSWAFLGTIAATFGLRTWGSFKG